MPKDKGPEWNHVVVLDSGGEKGIAYAAMKCLYCDKAYSGGVKRIRAHLTGGDTSITKCDKAPDEIVEAMKSVSTEKEKSDKQKKIKAQLDKLTQKPELSAGHKPLTQTTIVASMKSGFKEEADRAVAKLFYATGIPFSVVENKYFKDALQAVAKCGPGYKPPRRADISGKLLKETVTAVDDQLREVKAQMAVTGATLVSDGWTSVQNRPIINYLVVTPDGEMFINATDTSGKVKDGKFIAGQIKENIELVGSDNVVQVVTDSAGNCVAAKKILSDSYPKIVFSPCSAHCLDLLLEDIGKMSWAAKIIEEGNSVVKFISGHQAPLALFRKRSSLELLKPGETRFGTQFIMLQRLLQVKDDLQETVMDKEFKQWAAGKARRGGDSTAVTKTVVDENFWKAAGQLVSVCEPIIALLHLTDGTVPCVGKVYWQMYQLDTGIERLEIDDDKKKQIRVRVSERWKMLHTDLHSAGFVLDPEFRLFLQHENEEVT